MNDHLKYASQNEGSVSCAELGSVSLEYPDTSIGIEKPNSELIDIFPNPFSSQVTIKTNRYFNGANLTVENSFGQTVKQMRNISGQRITLHSDNLPKGIYFIRLAEGNKLITTKKIIITD